MKTGLKDIPSSEPWYGSGYCGICGGTNVYPFPCRYWDPDDGWKFGVLCHGCREDAKARPPHPDDYAFDRYYVAEAIDAIAETLGDDHDGTHSLTRDLGL